MARPSFKYFPTLMTCLVSMLIQLNPLVEARTYQTANDGFVEIMPNTKVTFYKSLFPKSTDPYLEGILSNSKTMFYDEQTIVPGYQDSAGDPEGFRPNTIQPELIDLAVPGGSKILFAKSGRFNFPFGSGGLDRSDNVVKINFWLPPTENGSVLPVVYWKLSFSRWRWLFPMGTTIGEILLIKFQDGDLKVFEIRTRKRALNGWNNQVYRPFLTPNDLIQSIKILRPQWELSSTLRNLMDHLTSSRALVPRTLESTHFRGSFEVEQGYLDSLPPFGDALLVKELLKNTPFKPVGMTAWRKLGGETSYAPSTDSYDSIIPKGYDAGVLAINDISCRRCHKNAGRQIGDYHFDLILYGEFWGEDEIFSWHPYETTAFVEPDGRVKNFNNDNRRLRQDFVSANLIKKFDSNIHPPTLYQEIPRDWQYRPIYSNR